MLKIESTVISKTADNNIITIWDYESDHHPITGYFQPSTTMPDVRIGDVLPFTIVCKKSTKGSFYNIIFVRKE